MRGAPRCRSAGPGGDWRQEQDPAVSRRARRPEERGSVRRESQRAKAKACKAWKRVEVRRVWKLPKLTGLDERCSLPWNDRSERVWKSEVERVAASVNRDPNSAIRGGSDAAGTRG